MKVVERDEVKKFLGEVWDKDTLTIIVRAHLHAEWKLNRLLEQYLPNPKALDLERMAFSRKLELVSALKLITEHTRAVLILLNKIRNRFAHDLNAEITQRDVDALLK